MDTTPTTATTPTSFTTHTHRHLTQLETSLSLPNHTTASRRASLLPDRNTDPTSLLAQLESQYAADASINALAGLQLYFADRDRALELSELMAHTIEELVSRTEGGERWAFGDVKSWQGVEVLRNEVGRTVSVKRSEVPGGRVLRNNGE